MNAPATITKPFNAFAAYEAERVYSRRLEKTLATALNLLSAECSRRELRGEDVAHIRTFISEAWGVSV